jgi:hypothetical protein
MQPSLTDITVTEIETLATMLNSAVHHMTTARNSDGSYPWYHADLSTAVTETCDGFYDIINRAYRASGCTAGDILISL